MNSTYSRKRLGKLHRTYFEKRLRKKQDSGNTEFNDSAFQQSLAAAIDAMLDVIDVNNRKISKIIDRQKS